MTKPQLFLASFLAIAATALSAGERPPNIIFILADDLGWSELGCYGNGFNETPHLDALAKAGVRCTQAYAAAPVCSPYRAAFLTGQHPARIGILDYLRPNSANGLSTRWKSLPSVLQSAGYTTGMIGKWHLTGYGYHKAEHETTPRDHGFSWDTAREVKSVGNGANFWPYVFRTQPIRWIDIQKNRLGEKEYLVDRMNLEAVEFIERNKDRPFFLYLSHYATHTILNGRPDLVEKYRKKHPPGRSTRTRCYLCQDHGHKGDSLHHWAADHNPHLAAMLESIDAGVGAIRRKLKELGIDKNTILVFSSDNGGETNVTSNAPLRGGKSQLYEGGVRVPLIVYWPGNIAGGRSFSGMTSNLDLFPTLASAAGLEGDDLPKLDGLSMLDALKGKARSPRRTIFWHYPLDKPHFLGGRSSSAIRDGDWKLIQFHHPPRIELYSMKNDVSEQLNVASENPGVIRLLSERLASWKGELGTTTPSPPLLTQQRQLYFADHFSYEHASERWWFAKEWRCQDGHLVGRASDKRATRIFLQNPVYKDVMIRFRFRFDDARELRLVTGSDGHYNAVIHILPDQFFVKTALDRRGPYFPYHHSECHYKFQTGKWYVITVEFLGDQVVAHLDHKHLAHAKHPVIDQERHYFAFQVDGGAVAIDDVQVFSAAKQKNRANAEIIAKNGNRFPVPRSAAERYKIEKANAHERLFRNDEGYRKLIEKLNELDERSKKLFPAVYRSHKEYRKSIQKHRRKLQVENEAYKQSQKRINDARRALERDLLERQPGANELPRGQRKSTLDRLEKKYRNDATVKALIERIAKAEQAQKKSYPELFISDAEILAAKKRAREKVKKDPKFIDTQNERAAVWRAQQEYLHQKDERLKEVSRKSER